MASATTEFDDAGLPILPRSAQVLYATGAFGAQVMLQSMTVWLFFVYAAERADGAPPLAPIAAVGLALTLGRFLDAIHDPIIGYLSDITRSRWGRRVPFVVVGSPIMALAFVLMWLPPVDGTSWWNALWLAGTLQFYFLMVTVVGAPFTGIYPEIAVRLEDRVGISSWQLVFGALGAAIGIVATGPMVEFMGFPMMATVIAVLGASTRYIGLLGARGRLHYQPTERLRDGGVRLVLLRLRQTLTNRNFVYLVGSLLCFEAGLLMVTQAIPYYVVELLGLRPAMQAPMTAAIFVTAIVAIPLTIRFTRRRGARQVYAWCLVGATATLPMLGLIGLSDGTTGLVHAMVIIGLIGIPLSGIFILPDALLAQVVDEDAASTESRREAMYFSSRATLEKLGQGLRRGSSHCSSASSAPPLRSRWGCTLSARSQR
jgi:glycoside/pentoside/hexuronide:cation symporter, GPH family